MRIAWWNALLVTAALLAPACTSSRSPRCKEICQREARCVRELRELDINFDEAECVAACAALDRDSEGKQLVAQHEQCVNQAVDCEAMMRCR